MLTQQQSKTLEFIKGFISDKGYAPTTGEIAEGLNIVSRGVVYRYLTALENFKYIELVPNRRRNIRLVIPGESARFEIPLHGKIAAGQAIEAVSMMDTLDVAGAFSGPKNYALLVKGDSMIEEGIHDGDYVICEQSNAAKNGDIVVALIDGEFATLKRIRYYPQEPRRVTLIPANATLQPVDYDVTRVYIQGIFRGLLRLCR